MPVTPPKPKILTLFLAVMLLFAAYITPVYAAGDYPEHADTIAIEAISANETMIVNATWLDDEMLRIDVLDTATGSVSSLAVRFSDFVANANTSPYIMIQAVDLEGNLSGIVRLSNPFYVPMQYSPPPGIEESAETEPGTGNTDGEETSEYNGYSDNGESDSLGLTPDGTGTVIDNIVTQNDIEFFTVFTEDGNEFFLVVDRQRNSDNVYLLNAVTETDLVALAQRNNNETDSPASNLVPPISEPPQEIVPTPVPTPEPDTEPEPEPSPEPQDESGGNGGLILIIVGAVAVGGIGYYVKIVRPRKSGSFDDEEDEDDDYGFDDEDEMDDESEGDD